MENTNPFEMGVATEVFGLDRPELPGIPYALDICGPGAVTMRQNFFTLTPSAPLCGHNTHRVSDEFRTTRQRRWVRLGATAEKNQWLQLEPCSFGAGCSAISLCTASISSDSI